MFRKKQGRTAKTTEFFTLDRETTTTLSLNNFYMDLVSIYSQLASETVLPSLFSGHSMGNLINLHKMEEKGAGGIVYSCADRRSHRQEPQNLTDFALLSHPLLC